MAEPHIDRFGPDDPSGPVIEAMERDGCAIVEGAISPELLSSLNAEFDELLRDSQPGNPNEPAALAEHHGRKTHRIPGLAGKSKSFVEVVQNERTLEIADHFLLPSCLHYLLSATQLIDIIPEETAQHLHRDDGGWLYPPIPTDRSIAPTAAVPQLELITFHALCDFTVANGATRVVPGSHLWPADRLPQEDEVVAAEMPAGSALYFLGKTLHGGGANQTTDQRRRALFFSFSLGWLRTKENHFLTTPIEAVRDMPPRVQQLLGYETHGGMGHVEVGTTSALVTSS